jgi:hypothetical protein
LNSPDIGDETSYMHINASLNHFDEFNSVKDDISSTLQAKPLQISRHTAKTRKPHLIRTNLLLSSEESDSESDYSI